MGWVFLPDIRYPIMIFPLKNNNLFLRTVGNRCTILPMLFLSSILTIYPQQRYHLSGFVRDAASGNIISDAVLHLGTEYIISNEQGFFSGNVYADSIRIQITHLTYFPMDTVLKIDKDLFLEFELHPSTVLLEDLLITHKKRTLLHRGLGNILIDAGQLKKNALFLGERDIIKSMQFLPGVSSGMEGSSQLNIRGGTNDQTLYLIDNVPVYVQNHAFGLFSVFNSETVREAEIYKSGIPASYGNHLSGVASIKTKNGNMIANSGSLSIGPLAVSGCLNGPIIKDKLSYLISVRKSLLDLLFETVSSLKGEVQTGAPQISFYDINGKLSYRHNERNNYSVIYYSGSDYFYNHSKKREKEDDIESIYTFKNKLGWSNRLLAVQSENLSGNSMIFNSSIYVGTLENYNTQYFRVADSKTSDYLQHGIFSNMLHAGANSTLQVKKSNHLGFAFGIQGIYQQFMPNYILKENNDSKEYFNIKKLSVHSYSAFVASDVRYKNWKISPGLRASVYYSGKTHFVLAPRLKMENNVREHEILMFSYDCTTQPIVSVNEMNYNSLTDFWIPFQDKIPISHQLSLGYKKIIPNRHLSFSVEAYLKHFNNLVMIKDIDYYLDGRSGMEFGTGCSRGIEFMLDYSNKNLSLLTTYVLSKTTRNFNGNNYPFKYDTPHDFSAHVHYNIHTLKRKKYGFSSMLLFRSGLPYFIPSIQYPHMGLPTDPSGYPYFNTQEAFHIPFEPNTRLNNYFRLDLNFTIEKDYRNGGKGTWQFSLLNATYHKNPYSVFLDKDQYKAFQLIPMLPSFSYSYNW